MNLANVPLFPDTGPDQQPPVTVGQTIEPLREAGRGLERAVAEFKDNSLPALAKANSLVAVRSMHIQRDYCGHSPCYDVQAVLDLPGTVELTDQIAAVRAWAAVLGASTRPGNGFVHGSSLCVPVSATVPLTDDASLTFRTYADVPIATSDVMAALGLDSPSSAAGAAKGDSSPEGSSR